MSKIKTGLGRGLDALINPPSKYDAEDYIETPTIKENESDVLTKIAVNLISPNPFQPRTSFEPEQQEELKNSILTNGLIQPITVRRMDDNNYQLISGERRLRACKDIGYREIPAYIIKVDSDETMLALALIENIQREKLNPIEIGTAYKRLMEDCHLTQEQIAQKVGKDRSTVANAIRLLKLPLEIQDALIKDEISMGHARAIINVENNSVQLQIYKKIIEEGLSVHKVEKLVKELSAGNKNNRSKIKTSHNSISSSISVLEERLRNILGTKVICRQNSNGAGELILEFYSNDELDRLLELFDLIEKNYN